jgi:ribosome-associated protein
MTKEENITVSELPIRLGQFLKLANIVQDGFEAKIRIQHGEIMLNGKVEIQRGKQLAEGDVVSFSGKNYRLIVESTNRNDV